MVHECKFEEQIINQSRKISEIEAHVDYKDKRIDEIILDQKRMEDKIDNIAEVVNQIQLQSVVDDKDIDNRVTSLETTVRVLKWIVGLLFGSGVLWLIIGLVK